MTTFRSRMTPVALRYLDIGWSIVPCHVPVSQGCSCGNDNCVWPGKHPRVNWREYQKRKPDRDEVIEWFENMHFDSNIGIVTGKISNLVVVDVDDGDFRALELPTKTLRAESGGGGRHFYYECDELVQSRIGWIKGVDLKAESGFIVAPPSRHRSGQKYIWTSHRKPLKVGGYLFPAPDNGTSVNSKQWFEEYLDGVEEGERSSVAARMSSRYVALGLVQRETEMLMGAWNEGNDPPLLDQELEATIRWAYRRHRENHGETVIETLSDLLKFKRKE